MHLLVLHLSCFRLFSVDSEVDAIFPIFLSVRVLTGGDWTGIGCWGCRGSGRCCLVNQVVGGDGNDRCYNDTKQLVTAVACFVMNVMYTSICADLDVIT